MELEKIWRRFASGDPMEGTRSERSRTAKGRSAKEIGAALRRCAKDLGAVLGRHGVRVGDDVTRECQDWLLTKLLEVAVLAGRAEDLRERSSQWAAGTAANEDTLPIEAARVFGLEAVWPVWPADEGERARLLRLQATVRSAIAGWEWRARVAGDAVARERFLAFLRILARRVRRRPGRDGPTALQLQVDYARALLRAAHGVALLKSSSPERTDAAIAAAAEAAGMPPDLLARWARPVEGRRAARPPTIEALARELVSPKGRREVGDNWLKERVTKDRPVVGR